MFCKSHLKNKYWLGKMMSREGINAHYYCILFSPGLQQNGEINEGFKGFLVPDINKEVRRGGQLSCSYCRKKGAVIGCAIEECKIKFHLTCGLVNKSFHDFHDRNKTYPSYCCQHRPIQKTARAQSKMSEEVCIICRDDVVRKPTPETLFTPCCCNWLHRECVIKQAYHSAKYHFKCPKCNDRDIFVKEMKSYGVHVPARDASWEKGETFNQMFKKHYECSAENCNSRKGKTYNGENEWELLACDGCGANAIHISCGNLDLNADEWFCPLCQPVLDTPNKKLRTVQQN